MGGSLVYVLEVKVQRSPFRTIGPARRLVVLTAVLLAASALTARVVGAQEFDLSHLQWRNIGPGGLGGRVADFAVHPTDHDTIYVGLAQGGVFKTVNGGISWEPVFDGEGSSAIGGLAVAPTNPNVIWVGTGESNGRNLVSSSWGDGVYKSEDGGKTWRNMGLPLSQHIGRIRVHPHDDNVVYVPVIGSLWHDSAEHNAARGLWRTIDGGTTWERILSAGERAGIFDLEIDPRDPDLMYATGWQRQRVDWSWLPTGDDGGLFRSRDGGDSWERMTNGLPTTQVGKVGVSVCRSTPDVVYSIFEGPEGGVFRSQDRGASWERRSAQLRGSHWYAQIRCDPGDSERVYVLETRFMVSHDGGRTFTNEMAGKPVHVDHHALWIDPGDSDRLVLGNDGGIYLSRDRGDSWRFVDLSITQFFEIGVGMQEPFYYVCGGTQDNNSYCGPSATRHADGIVNDDWFQISGGDGFYAPTDPSDSTIIYSESQHGGLVRVDTRTGERKRIKPVDPRDLRADGAASGAGPSGEAAADPRAIDVFRWNWSAPVLISRWDPATIYFGAQTVLRSPDRGDRWEILSPDLTRALTYDSPMNDFGTLRVIVESPLRQGLMAVGTDDGLVQISDDGGDTWRATEPLPGVPELALVRRIILSAHDPETLYVASSYHEYNDFTPYLLKSEDLGRSWESIVANLPDGGPIRALAEHPRNPALLFVGTEHGVWASFDGGGAWASLRNNLPTVAIHDMVIHPRDNDLVVGTHGRGIWILDHINVLEGLTEPVRGAEAYVFPVRPTLQFNRQRIGRGSRGSTYFRAPNPPAGAILDVRVAGDAELTIHDAAGNQVRHLEVPSRPGLHRVEWDLRYEPTWTAPEGSGGGFGFGGQGTVRGPWVMPGVYEARLTVGDTAHHAAVEVRADPLATISADDRRLWHDLQVSLSHILGTARAASAAVGRVDEALREADAALQRRSGELPPEAVEQARAVMDAVRGIRRSLGELSRLAGQAYGALGGSTSRPTDDQLAIAETAYRRLGEQLEALERVRSEEIPGLAATLGALGVPSPIAAPLLLPEGARPPRSR